jgi:hypothetical protein
MPAWVTSSPASAGSALPFTCEILEPDSLAHSQAFACLFDPPQEARIKNIDCLFAHVVEHANIVTHA